jgi:NitT/TauT family transport system ATP-binding protein
MAEGLHLMVSSAALARVDRDTKELSVEIRNVSHSFELDGGSLPVLDNISVKIAPGEFVSFLGPSGCGKSTLLRLVAGLEAPTAGSIYADDELVKNPNPSRILAFQDATLFPWATVWRNIATGLEARGELRGNEHRIDEAIDLVKLTQFAKAYPHQLSGGMAQRAALARALVNDPKILLLDEPFGKLDALTRMTLQDELLRLWSNSGFTAALVTHDVEEALLLSNRVIVMSDRPAHIVKEFAVPFAYPRRRDDRRIIALRRQILETLGLIGSKANEAGFTKP